MVRRPRPRSPHLHLAILALLAATGGMSCQFSPGGLSGNPDTPDAMVMFDAPPPIDAPVPIDAPAPIDASPAPDAPTPIDAQPAPDARPAPDAAPPDPVLVSRELLTRYFIDEATDGTAPLQLEDAASDPLPLTIDYQGDGEFIDDGGHRGLRWNAVTQGAKAAAFLAEDGKVWLGLNNATQATIELVVDVDAFIAGSRLSHVGEADDAGVFTLRIDDPESFALAWNNSGRRSWAMNVDALGRVVLHVVYDSTQTAAAQRLRLYVNGVEQSNGGGSPPDASEPIEIISESATVYALGNTQQGDRGVAGTFYYAAMYRAALNATEVANNATLLLANDDGPAGR
jgi:hypothetical protein